MTTPLGRALHEITQLFESANGADSRVRKTLELLRGLVPYDQCGVMEIGLPEIVAVPEAAGEARERLAGVLLAMFGEFVEGASPPPAPLAASHGAPAHLAVPLVGLDEVIGILYVSSATDYTEDHLRALSLVAGKLAAYFSMRRAQTELFEFARERDVARREAEQATQAKDEFLSLISTGLRAPVSSILAWTRVLRTSKDHSERLDAIDQLERHVQAQAALVDDVLEIAAARASPIAGPSPYPVRGTVSGGRLAGIRVLVIDHDLGLRESFQAALAHYEAEVESVASAPEALEALERARPHVLLFGDLTARGASTAELMREITARTCPLAVVSISAWRVQEGSEPGFRLHLRKPLEMEALVDAVASVVGRPSRD